MKIDVALTPPPAPPPGRACLVVDVLRATSMISTLLERGLHTIYPAAGIDAARSLRDRLLRAGVEDRLLLCGEERTLRPDGFDLGNSPAELAGLELPPVTAAVVATTNGTPALVRCAGAPFLSTVAPLNVGAALDLALETAADLLVVCAGSHGRPAADDTLAAGLVVERAVRRGLELESGAREAHRLYLAAGGDLFGALSRTPHGRRLLEYGFEEDVRLCATIDAHGRAGRVESREVPEVGRQPVLRAVR